MRMSWGDAFRFVGLVYTGVWLTLLLAFVGSGLMAQVERSTQIETEHRLTSLETWEHETQWEIHGTLGGVAALVLERAFGRKKG